MSKIVQLYAGEIRAGRITIEEVPPGLREKVEAALSESTEDGNPE